MITLTLRQVNPAIAPVVVQPAGVRRLRSPTARGLLSTWTRSASPARPGGDRGRAPSHDSRHRGGETIPPARHSSPRRGGSHHGPDRYERVAVEIGQNRGD